MPRAIVFSEYGDSDVLTLTEVPLPAPGPGQIRVRVHASGVNPMDWKIALGQFQPPEIVGEQGVQPFLRRGA